ncbi:metal ABC transporter ATP-binding protein [Aquicella lusitana]|uniref:Zinc/manganese transport system ATP-binding protein n=1 Tax=Aquicella lusitana TaxID=254246 RepID=A0A370GL29_9COXI|nr:ATP-binding cassette domain-containing protein [Aquicella lusitana]RDI42593.1 zinc/manganese transport system ATP-binding protein [Aquicella lusitana]VVC74371.1 putative ABC transporter ATP-binding protein [Aquicella lusitana]
MNNHIVISTEHADIGYKGRQPVIENINISIRAGEFIGIFGPNGSGKSTFLRALLGLLKPLSGKINVLGAAPYQGHKQIGYMPQMRTHASVANLTGRAILSASFNGTRYGLPFLPKGKRLEIQKILELVNANSYADRPLHTLSGGEKQRIFLAQALLDKPDILLLDEPLANLDPRYQDTFIRLLQDIQQHLHVTILFSAHDPNPLLDVMNRVLYFAQRKAIIGAVDEIITSSMLSSLYGIPIEVIHIKNRLFVLGEGRHIHEQELHHHD